MNERSAMDAETDRVDAMTQAGQVKPEYRAYYDDDLLARRMDRDFELGHIHTSHGSS